MTEMNGESREPARYSELTAAIHAAGFFTSGIEDKDGCWDRVTVCSRNVSGILCGNSFWVAELPSGWYLGAWGGTVYRIPESTHVAEFCVTWMKAEPCLKSDFSSEMKVAFGLNPVSDKEFEHSVGGLRLEIEAKAIAEVATRAAVEPDQLIAEACWDGNNWQVLVWNLPATGVADYSLTISRDSKSVDLNAGAA
jgi:hypothetical protein